jgi:hypothetical protein
MTPMKEDLDLEFWDAPVSPTASPAAAAAEWERYEIHDVVKAEKALERQSEERRKAWRTPVSDEGMRSPFVT